MFSGRIGTEAGGDGAEGTGPEAGSGAAAAGAGHERPAEAGAGASSGAEAEVDTAVGAVVFHATRNAIYHVARRRRLDLYNRIANFVVVLLGTAAASEIIRGTTGWSALLGGVTAAVGALQLTFDFSGRARTHELLQKRYFDVLAEIARTTERDFLKVADWDATLYTIYSDEPPMAPVHNADAHNDAINSLGRDPDSRIIVPIRARLLGFAWPFDGADWPTRGERRERKAARVPFTVKLRGLLGRTDA